MKIAHFFHPAAERFLAYIFPIAPIPISPMVGCRSAGASGVTSRRVISKVRVDKGDVCSSQGRSVMIGNRGQPSESKPSSRVCSRERKVNGQRNLVQNRSIHAPQQVQETSQT
jgi:hypothetical protein